MRHKNNNGDTALHVAVRNRYVNVVRLLLQRSVDIAYIHNSDQHIPEDLIGQNETAMKQIFNNCNTIQHNNPIYPDLSVLAVEDNDVTINKKHVFANQLTYFPP